MGWRYVAKNVAEEVVIFVAMLPPDGNFEKDGKSSAS